MDDKERFVKGKNITVQGLLVNFLLSLFKLTSGIAGKSQAMIADAIHTLSDFCTDIVVLLGLALGCRPKDKSHPYGHGKFETLSASLIGLALAAVAFKMGQIALVSLISKNYTIPKLIALWAAIISIITKEVLYRYTIFVGKKIDSQAVIANAWHHRSDALSSIATLAGIGAARAGFPVFDPLAALLVCFFILKVSFDITKISFLELVETSVSPDIIEQIKQIAQSKKEVISVHGIKARKVGPKIEAELHIVLNPNITLLNAHAIADTVETNIISQVKGMDEVLVHIDPRK